jgi:hypothetical protein
MLQFIVVSLGAILVARNMARLVISIKAPLQKKLFSSGIFVLKLRKRVLFASDCLRPCKLQQLQLCGYAFIHLQN